MADEIIHTDEDRPRDTVVVREGRGLSTWLTILGIVLLLLALFWFFGNPFASDSDGADVNVEVPAPNVNVETPAQ